MEGGIEVKLSTPTRENHEALWNWLAKNPNSTKYDWPGFATMRKLGIAYADAACFLCEDLNKGIIESCKLCPLHRCATTACDGSNVYSKYAHAKGTTRIKLALLIANCFNVPVTREAVLNVRS
jgi:hypothetical protein